MNTVLFDLDGTLVQHGHALLPPILAEHGVPRSPEAVRTAVVAQLPWYRIHVIPAEENNTVPDFYRQFYIRVLDALQVEDPNGTVTEYVTEHFAQIPAPPLFEDVQPVLEHLVQSQWNLGVITQRGRVDATRFLDAHDLVETFHVLITGDDGHGRKPDAGPFHAALRHCGVTSQEAVYIGDLIEDDCNGARNAGVRPFLIDREGRYLEQVEQHSDIVYLRDLEVLLDHLPENPHGKEPPAISG